MSAFETAEDVGAMARREPDVAARMIVDMSAEIVELRAAVDRASRRAPATELAAPISLPTRSGRIDLRNAPTSAKCSTGCKTMGGGFLLASVYESDGTLKGHIPICGNCLALAIVRRIDEVEEARHG